MHVVVEGLSDEAMARRVVEHAGGRITRLRSAGGRTKLDPKLLNYCRAARETAWIVFRDSDGHCPVSLREQLLAKVPENPLFLFRIVHTMTEAWLMADAKGFASYFKVKQGRVPASPEDVSQAKQTFLGLCLQSQSRNIREEVVRKDGQPGPLFVHHLNEFATTHWQVDRAAEASPSLRRAIAAIRELQSRTF